VPSSLNHYARKVPFRWFAGAVAVIGLGVSSLFHGLAPVPAAETPTVKPGKVIDAGPWTITVVDTRLLSSSEGLTTTTDGDHWFAIVATVDDTTTDSRDDMGDIVRLSHVAGLTEAAPQRILLTSDASTPRYLNPGMPERVAFLWEQSASAPLPTTAQIVIYGKTLRTNTLDATTDWLSPHVVADVTAPVLDKRT
jgi:hypothetical protein